MGSCPTGPPPGRPGPRPVREATPRRSGDVLAGCITGLLAQGYAPFYAACLGVYVCGRAGEKAQQRLGMTAMLPTDTIAALPEVFRSLEQKQGDALFE